MVAMTRPHRPSPEKQPGDQQAIVLQIEQARQDYGWFFSQPELLARYPDQVVLLHKRMIVGHGPNDLEAMEEMRRQAAAEQRAVPPLHELLRIVVPPADWEEMLARYPMDQ
jgi:hypothetical protein